VHPGADPAKIAMLYRSAKAIDIDSKGNVILENKAGILHEAAPVTFQENNSNVSSRYILISTHKKRGLNNSLVGFEIGSYNRDETLVIDPQLQWATFFGGTNYEGTYCIDTDPAGNVFLCGYVASTNFPLLSTGSFSQSTGSSFIVKFNNNGTLLWSTLYLGGAVMYLDTDNSGNLFICGQASGTVIPLMNAGTYFQNTAVGADAYIAKFNSSGVLTWATFYGGSGSDYGMNIATDPQGNVFLTGITSSTNFPLQNNSTYFEGSITGTSSGFAVKFDNTGNRLWATYVKGLQQPCSTTDGSGNYYLTGWTNLSIPLLNPGGGAYYQAVLAGNSDLYIIKFDNIGNLKWGTYYGGNSLDRGMSVVCDRNKNVFLTGITNSTNLPVQNAGTYFQAVMSSSLSNETFVLKFDSTATRQWATYFGGTRNDQQLEYDNLTVDTCGNLFLGLTTTSRNLPFIMACDSGMFDNSIDSSVSATAMNVYLARFSNSGNLMWSSLFGGDGNSFRTTLAADRFGNVFFSGEWNGVVNPATYPLRWPGGTTYTANFMGYEDLYVAKFTNNLPAQNFSYPTLCTGDANQLPVLTSGFSSGGTFSASPGLSINPATGLITTSASTAGTYVVNYMKVPCYCPGAANTTVGSATVTLSSGPSLSIAGKTLVCVGQKQTYTASGASNYTWSTGSSIATMSMTAPTTTGTIIYTVSATGTNACVSKKTISVSISKCIGIEEVMQDALTVIYPNPNSGNFTISSITSGNFILVNEMGQKVREIKLSAENKQEVKIEGLAKGIYFLEEPAGKQKKVYKIVVSD
jgi:hypothetical protein